MTEDQQVKTLISLLAKADDEGFIGALLEDLFTYKEIRDIASRLNVAIARVSKCLNHGAGGYTEAIARLKT